MNIPKIEFKHSKNWIHFLNKNMVYEIPPGGGGGGVNP